MLRKIGLLLILQMSCMQAIGVTNDQSEAVKSALKNNKWSKAMDLAEDLVDEFPNNADAHYLFARSIRVKMEAVSQVRAMFSIGDYKKSLSKAIQLNPRHLDARTEEIGFYVFAPGIAGGDKELAKKKIDALHLIDPVKGFEMDLLLAESNQNRVKQIQITDQLISLKPNDPKLKMNKAGLYLNQKNYQKAELALLDLSNQQFGQDWQLAANYQRAKWRILAKQDIDLSIELLTTYKNTIETVKSEINLPNKAASLWRLALAYEIQGKQDVAIDMLKQSVKLDKTFEQAVKDLKRLRQ